jgi:hypothetical protein
MFQKLLFIFIGLSIISCKKEESDTPITNIKYRLYLPKSFNLDISYYSDKYFDSGTLESFNLNNDNYSLINNKYWEAKRIQNNKDSGYYFEAQINSLESFEGELKLFIYLNDSILIDSSSFNHSSSEIKIKGDIPKTF